MTAPDVTRFPGVHTRSDSNAYQFGLKPPDELRHHFPGRWAVRCSLRTTNLNEANAKAKVLHAEWAQKFAALHKSDNPVAVDLTPALAAAIAAELRRWVLQADDNMRAFAEVPNALLALEQRKRQREAGGIGHDLLIDVPTVAASDDSALDPLGGLSEAQRGAVSRLNAREEGCAAVDMAARNLRAVQPMAAAVAKSMGLLVDWTSEGGRAGLLECLKSYRAASRELIHRDAGDVVETPPEQHRPLAEPVPTAPASP